MWSQAWSAAKSKWICQILVLAVGVSACSPVTVYHSLLHPSSSLVNSGAGTVQKNVPSGLSVLHSFNPSTLPGKYPHGSVIPSHDGNTLYGFGSGGGAGNSGAIYSYALNSGAMTTLYSFTGGSDGASPLGSPALSSDGTTLYGMTYTGGSSGLGSIFSSNLSTNTFTSLYGFTGGSDGNYAPSSVILSHDGATLYGMTQSGGDHGSGNIFSFDLGSSSLTTLYSFTGGVDGHNPQGAPVLSPDGNTLYGITEQGGTNFDAGIASGVIFSYSLNTQTLSTLHSFVPSTDGRSPFGGATLSSDGTTLYGMTAFDGPNGSGAVFKYDLNSNTLTALHGFSGGADGGMPFSTPSLSPDGSQVFGVTYSGGASNNGVLFQYTIASSQYNTLYSFTGGNDGKNPYADITLSADGGSLYGTTNQGGASSSGTLFSFSLATQTLTTLSGFVTDGTSPLGDLILSADGTALYGMTSNGGTNGDGVIFSYSLSQGTETILHTFNGTDGSGPRGNLLFSPDKSTLYGMTLVGGQNNFGSIFSYVLASQTFTSLYSFTNGTDGSIIVGSPTISQDGNTIYGVANLGGNNNFGAIFSFDIPSQTLTTLYSFSGNPDGQSPNGSPILSADGNTLYGMTSAGGINGLGTIYSYALDTNTYSLLYSFSAADGTHPQNGSLTLSHDGGTLYGLIFGGGADSHGIVFSYSVDSNTMTTLYTFTGATDGGSPEGGLTLSSDGNTLYGMTMSGGANGDGIIFKYDLHSSQLSTLLPFTNSNGATPYGSLIFSSDGSGLYGMTSGGGAYNGGTLFSFGF